MPRPRRVLVLGAAGQVGRELVRALGPLGDVTAWTRREAELTNLDRLEGTIRRLRPDVIVNAAAYTAVDRAESEPDLAWRVNAEAPGRLAAVARELDALLVHYSTDYVFDGTATTPIPETAPTHPINVYGRTKREGEEAIAAVGGRSVILRTGWVYADHGHNFLQTMRRLGDERERLTVVHDQCGAPTSAAWLADATVQVIERAIVDGLDAPDLIHAVCSGETSWFGFAEAIFDLWPPSVLREVVPIPTDAFPTPARRPAYSVLATEHMQARYGVQPPPWRAALSDLSERGGR